MGHGTIRLINPLDIITEKLNEMMSGLGTIVQDAVGETLNEIFRDIYTGIYNKASAIYDTVSYEYGTNFGINFTAAANDLTKTPEEFNASAFAVARNVASTAVLPVASALLTIVFCWEMVQLVQNSNNGNNVTPEKLLLPLMKMCLCLLACSKGFDLISAIFRLGATAASVLSGSVTSSFTTLPTFDELGMIDPTTTIDPATGDEMRWGFKHVLSGIIGVLTVGAILILFVVAMILIKMITIAWFIETYIYASMVSVPMSTWMNREWSSMGMNYVKKLLALSLRGLMMLIIYAIFGGIMSSVMTSAGTGFLFRCAMLIGSVYLLITTLRHSGHIAESIIGG